MNNDANIKREIKPSGNDFHLVDKDTLLRGKFPKDVLQFLIF
jgi:hypothetical protein